MASSLSLVTQIAINGLALSAEYAMIALGFTLLFGILRIVNFAHGSLFMLGAMFTYEFCTVFHLPYFEALLLGALSVAALGLLLERIAYRPFYGRELQGIIATLGLAIMLQYAAVILWGQQPLSISPTPFPAVLHIAGASLPSGQLVIIVIATFLLLAFYYFTRFTKLGLALRVVAEDPEIAQAQGIHLNVVYVATFLTSVLLAALAGGLIGQQYTLTPSMGTDALIKAFIIVILGGLGSVPGSILGSVLLGLGTSTLDTLFGGNIAEVTWFVAIIVLLAVRPSGLLGRSHG